MAEQAQGCIPKEAVEGAEIQEDAPEKRFDKVFECTYEPSWCVVDDDQGLRYPQFSQAYLGGFDICYPGRGISPFSFPDQSDEPGKALVVHGQKRPSESASYRLFDGQGAENSPPKKKARVTGSPDVESICGSTPSKSYKITSKRD